MSKTNDELEKEIKGLRDRFKRVIDAQQRDISNLGGEVFQLKSICAELARRVIELEKRIEEFESEENEDDDEIV